MTEHLTTYLELMHEIKRRHISADLAYDEPHRLMFKATTIDFCYTNFRKILELVAFSVLSSNQTALRNSNRAPSRDYHAEKVLKFIEKKFGPVYPIPITQVMDPRPGVKADFVNIAEGYLTRSEFAKLYSECGDVLHSRNPFRKPLDLDFYWPRVPYWSERIRALLNSHIATIVDDPNLHLIQMGAGTDEPPYANTFAPLS